MSYTLLHIDSSPLADRSISRKLTQKLVNELKEKHPDHRLITHDFGNTPLPHLSAEVVGAFFTPDSQRNPSQEEALKVSDQLVKEFLSADVIVIGAPMWNLGIPSSLKAWIDHLVRAGKTFQYTPTGVKGLVPEGKKIIIVSSRGGIYTQGPAMAMDHQETYLKTIFNFLGITDISFIRAEGVSMGEAAKEEALKTANSQLNEVLQTA